MKPFFLTKLLSYFIDVQFDKTNSDYSGELEVIYRKGRFALCTKNAVYSYDDLYINFRKSFEQLDLDAYNIQEVLVLGLGLGSIPLLLEKIFKKKYSYTLVEIDQKIVDLAYKYTLAKLQSPVNVICADAWSYVDSYSHKKFDLVIIDIFIDDQVPISFESVHFLENIKRILSPNGLLMYNRLTYNEQLNTQTDYFFEATFNKVFDKASFLSLDGNKMLLNYLIPIKKSII